MATGDKFERHRQGGATEHKRSLCREMATSPADGSAQPSPIDVTGFTPVTVRHDFGGKA